jgi:hypothetical protein
VNHHKTNTWAKSLNYAVPTSRVKQHCTGNNGMDGDTCEREITRNPEELASVQSVGHKPHMDQLEIELGSKE